MPWTPRLEFPFAGCHCSGTSMVRASKDGMLPSADCSALPAAIISGPLLIGPLSKHGGCVVAAAKVLFGAQVNQCRRKAEATPCWLLQAAELDTELDAQGVIAGR